MGLPESRATEPDYINTLVPGAPTKSQHSEQHRLAIAQGEAQCWLCKDGPVTAESLVVGAICVWAAAAVHATVTDLREAIISRRVCWAAGITILGLLSGAAVLADDLSRLAWVVAGATSVGLLFEAIYRLVPGKVGFGDVRLIIVDSLLVGWWGLAWVWWALFAGAVAAWPVAIFALVRVGRHAKVRWAPGLVAGAAAVIAYRLWIVGVI